MNDSLTEDTKAILLLCGVFGKTRSEKPLSSEEYTSLVHWLMRVEKWPKDLLQEEVIADASMGSGIDKQRLEKLLDSGVQLGFAVEEWQRSGIWIISRSDDDYPKRYKKHLKAKAPPLLFGVGNRALLSGGGFGIVGSRDVDHVGEDFTCEVAELCACSGIPVISGGARGVDKISMTTALEAGGVTVGILADNLLKKSVERNYRQAIADERLLLLSPYHPNASFRVWRAMERNKLIYAMSDYSLIVSADYQKGGTWKGAEEELKRENSRPVFVRIGKDVPEGNTKLQELGAAPWHESINNFMQQLQKAASAEKLLQVTETDVKQEIKTQEYPVDQNPDKGFLTAEETCHTEESPVSNASSQNVETVNNQASPSNAYQAILLLMLSKLDNLNSATAEELAKALEVNKTQLKAWLKQAEEEKYLTKRLIYVRVNQSQENLGKEKQETLDFHTPSLDIYKAVLPHILSRLEKPIPAKELAQALGVNKTQLKAWLKQTEEEKYLTKRLMYIRVNESQENLGKEKQETLDFHTPSLDIYKAVLPHILSRLDKPIPAKELAKALGVNKTQLKAWLKQAVKDGRIKELFKPERYEEEAWLFQKL